MGSICPCSRDHTSSIPSPPLLFQPNTDSDVTLSTEISTSRPRAKVVLRAEDNIIRLVGSLQDYYEVGEEITTESEIKRVRGVYLGTQQPCVITILQKTDKINRAKVKAALFAKLNALTHPSILKMLEMMQDAEHLYVVFEDYWRDIASFQERTSEKLVAQVMRQVLSALAYVHSRGFVHGHISAKSIVVKRKRSDDHLDVKLSGFEFLDLSNDKATASDIWSCGALLAYLLTGAVVSSDHCEYVVFSHPIWNAVSSDALSLITSMLRPKAEARPSALQCLAHPWTQQAAARLSLKSPSVRLAIRLMREYKECATLKEALTRFVLARVSQDCEHLAEMFRGMDSDGDGFVSVDELLHCFEKTMPAEQAREEAKKVLEKVDKNRNGLIDYSEFLLAAVNPAEVLSEANLRTAFGSLDVDNSGAISLQELKRLLVLNCNRNSEGEWRRLMAEYDLSGDGELDFEEFRGIMDSDMDR